MILKVVPITMETIFIDLTYDSIVKVLQEKMYS